MFSVLLRSFDRDGEVLLHDSALLCCVSVLFCVALGGDTCDSARGGVCFGSGVVCALVLLSLFSLSVIFSLTHLISSRLISRGHSSLLAFIRAALSEVFFLIFSYLFFP